VKLRLKEITGSFFQFPVIQTAVPSHGLTLWGHGERSSSGGLQKCPILRNCLAKSSIQGTRIKIEVVNGVGQRQAGWIWANQGTPGLLFIVFFLISFLKNFMMLC